MSINENALSVLKEKCYFKEGESKWEDICSRVSKAIASAEEKGKDKKRVQKDVYDAMVNLEFIFSTPCLINADENNGGQLSSCFVLPVEDNIESIFKCLQNFAKIFQKNGGAGTNLSAIRPAKSPVETSGGYSSGPIGFMHGFDWVGDEMTRHNPTRKGAIKIDLAVWHPDVIDFIKCKDNTDVLQRMNISVALTDGFIKAVENDLLWDLVFPDYSKCKEEYDKYWKGDIFDWINRGYPTKTYHTMPAKELMHIIAEHAHKTGEPGISYQTNMNKGNMNKHLHTEVFGNPCHEFTNIPYSSCNLGSINLAKCVDIVDNVPTINYMKLRTLVINAIRWVDNMITINKLPLKEIEEMTKAIRPIGLGTMGLAELLFMMNIPYNSDKAITLVHDIYEFIADASMLASIDLAKERGVYPAWEGSEWFKQGLKVRNSNLLSIAPNGTIAFIADTTGGIEPLFALVYTRRTYDGNIYRVENQYFINELKKRNLYSDALMQKIIDNNGSCQGIKEIPEDIQKVFVVASDLSPEEHLNMVTTIQRYVDLSISKTVNFNNNATIEDIEKTFIMASNMGCKGLTVYRDGSRSNQTLAVKREDDEVKTQVVFDSIEPVDKDELGETINGTSVKRKVACGNLYIQVFEDQKGNLAEMYINTSKGGICQANINLVSRLISLALRSGVKVEQIIDQAKDIKCSGCSILRKTGVNVERSCSDAIANYLIEKYYESTDKKSKHDDKENKCPNCGQKIRMEQGCVICSCGFSRCG